MSPPSSTTGTKDVHSPGISRSLSERDMLSTSNHPRTAQPTPGPSDQAMPENQTDGALAGLRFQGLSLESDLTFSGMNSPIMHPASAGYSNYASASPFLVYDQQPQYRINSFQGHNQVVFPTYPAQSFYEPMMTPHHVNQGGQRYGTARDGHQQYRPPVTYQSAPHFPGTLPHHQQYQSYSSPNHNPGWTSSPQSPGNMNQGNYRGHSRNTSVVTEEFGIIPRGPFQASYPSSPWNTSSQSSPFAYYTPQPQPMGVMDQAPDSEWSYSPQLQSGYPNNRYSSGRPMGGQIQYSNNRASFSGASRPNYNPEREREPKEKERKVYHPQAPARRSDWVMWVGNVPNNTSHEELWRFFNAPIPGTESDPEVWRGPSSIFLISRSSCAFVNLSSQADLERAVQYFNGRPLRPWDSRCPRMLCRVRKKDDDLRAGVGAQRGTGMHREWVKGQENPLPTLDISSPKSPRIEPPSPAILEHPPDGEGRRRESIDQGLEALRHQSTQSFASTNSSFLIRYFPKRVFILKSLTVTELEESLNSGTWRTQKHNEPILDQAFRTAQEVFFVFSANKSGEFFGFAKMIEYIDKEKAAAKAATAASRTVSFTSKGGGSNSSSSGSGPHSGPLSKVTSVPPPERINEEPEGDDRERALSDPLRPTYLLHSRSSQSQHLASSSPGELTPAAADETGLDQRRQNERRTESPQPADHGSFDHKSTVSAPAATGRVVEQSPEPEDSYFAIIPNAKSTEIQVSRQEQLGGSHRKPVEDAYGVLRKDTALSPEEKAQRIKEEARPVVADEFPPEGWGHVFKIEWIRVGALPFGQIRHMRNPWNADKEVKVSRDGTEVEPGIGTQLMAEWDKLQSSPSQARLEPPHANQNSSYPSYPTLAP